MREDLIVRTAASCLKRKGVEEYSVFFTTIAIFNVHIITLKRTVNNATNKRWTRKYKVVYTLLLFLNTGSDKKKTILIGNRL
jgi:L-rhamnose mutarotase